MQPLQSLELLRDVKHTEMSVNGSDARVMGDGYAYARRKVEQGLSNLEALLCDMHAQTSSSSSSYDPALVVFAAGTAYATMADLCLVPQIYNARIRLGITVDDSSHPRLTTVIRVCESLAAFQAAAPDKQPDAV
jgi:maleylpyruvate isomerase